MPTDKQTKNIIVNLRQYRRKYLQQKFADLDESATRIIVNSLLCDVLGYEELVDIKTEYRIRELYADYVIVIKGKAHLIVEVKAKKLALSNKHLRQSVEYGVNEGIDWVLLTNGEVVELHRILFERPVRSELFFRHDLNDYSNFKQASRDIYRLSKRAVISGQLEEYWDRRVELSYPKLAKLVGGEPFLKLLRKELKKKTGLYFKDHELNTAMQTLIRSAEAGLKA